MFEWKIWMNEIRVDIRVDVRIDITNPLSITFVWPRCIESILPGIPISLMGCGPDADVLVSFFFMIDFKL
jgi:hypothetical protein